MCRTALLCRFNGGEKPLNWHPAQQNLNPVRIGRPGMTRSVKHSRECKSAARRGSCNTGESGVQAESWPGVEVEQAGGIRSCWQTTSRRVSSRSRHADEKDAPVESASVSDILLEHAPVRRQPTGWREQFRTRRPRLTHSRKVMCAHDETTVRENPKTGRVLLRGFVEHRQKTVDILRKFAPVQAKEHTSSTLEHSGALLEFLVAEGRRKIQQAYRPAKKTQRAKSGTSRGETARKLETLDFDGVGKGEAGKCARAQEGGNILGAYHSKPSLETSNSSKPAIKYRSSTNQDRIINKRTDGKASDKSGS
ncbi:hypothetical protein C8R46DRAFT_1271451 [Mycena filopes]|nr:hypothetical protein C8R46DRAFT_1271451 [Mycena filopes]